MINYIDFHWWPLMWFTSGIAIISFWFMAEASRYFYYDRWTKRSFSIIDLQFPSSARYYSYILFSLKNQYKGGMQAPLKALKRNLWWDFVFMLGIYPMTAFLCLHVFKLWNNYFFLLLAFLQIIACILDVLENSIIFRTIAKPKLFIITKTPEAGIADDDKDASKIYRFYRRVVSFKWILAGTGLVMALIAILYNYFYTENYGVNSSWRGLLTFLAILVALMVGGKIREKEIS